MMKGCVVLNNSTTKDKMKDKLNAVSEKVKGKILPVAVGVGASVASAVPCFAADPVSTFVVTNDMIAPIGTSITTSMTNMLPTGLTVMAVMIGLSLIPRFIYKFL